MEAREVQRIRQGVEAYQRRITHPGIVRRAGRAINLPYRIGRKLYDTRYRDGILQADVRNEIFNSYVKQRKLVSVIETIPYIGGLWISSIRAYQAAKKPVELPRYVDLSNTPYFNGQRNENGKYTVTNPVKAVADIFSAVIPIPNFIAERLFKLIVDKNIFRGVEAELAYKDPDGFIKRETKIRVAKHQLQGQHVRRF